MEPKEAGTEKKFIPKLLDKLSDLGALPTDSEDERLLKASLLLTALLMGLAAALWSSIFFLLGRNIPGSIPGTYSLVTFLSIGHYAITKRYSFFRFSQIFLILVLPFILQASMGGFSDSNLIMAWALLPVMGALVFHQTQAAYWFVAYEVFIAASAFFDKDIRAAFSVGPLPEPWVEIFWAGNIGGVSLLVYLVMRFVIAQNNRSVQESRAQRARAETALKVVGEQAEQLKELDKSKTLFFANVSHELRTPLTLLLGPLQTTLDSGAQLPSDVKRRLSLAFRNGRRLLRQINLLLDFTKAEAGNMELDLSEDDPVMLAADLVEETQPAALARNLTLSVETTDNLGLIEIDRDRIEQAILNLLSNAIKFTPPGGEIKVIVTKVDDNLRISIKDSGIGIPEDQIGDLFQSFKQVKRKSDGQESGGAMFRQEHQGTGLGLALSKQIIELHKGTIKVESVVGQGTTFHIIIPMISSAKAAASAISKDPNARKLTQQKARTHLADIEAANAAKEERSDGLTKVGAVAPDDDGRPLVLIVDDHDDVRSYLIDLLQDKYRLIEAADGQEGIDVARSQKPNAIISDVMMPRKSGFELVQELKDNAKTRIIPILLLTARGNEGTVEGLERGADDYLSKPFEPSELMARLFALLRLTEVEQELAQVNDNLAAMNTHMADELDAAKTIQESLMPSGALSLPRFDIGGRMLPAEQLGGDFYDFIQFNPDPNEGSVALAIGDVTGHGAASALVTAVAKATLQSRANAEVAPKDLLSVMTRVVADSCQGKKYMTFFYGLLDLKSGILRYSNAGQNFPRHFIAAEQQIKSLNMPGNPLGLYHDQKYDEDSVQLASGDILVLYSDGIIEAEDHKGRQFGARRLQKLITSKLDKSAQEIADVLVDEAVAYAVDHKVDDDMTAVVIKMR